MCDCLFIPLPTAFYQTFWSHKPGRWKRVSYCGFNLYFSGIEHVFLCSRAIIITFSLPYLFIYNLSKFLVEPLGFFLLICRNSFYIKNLSLISVIWVANIFLCCILNNICWKEWFLHKIIEGIFDIIQDWRLPSIFFLNESYGEANSDEALNLVIAFCLSVSFLLPFAVSAFHVCLFWQKDNSIAFLDSEIFINWNFWPIY